MDRDKIEKQYKWDLSQIFKSQEEFDKYYEDTKNKINKFSRHEKIMTDSSANFYNAIDEYYQITRQLEKLYVYVSMSFDVDTSNNKSQAQKIKVANLYDEWSKITFFITPSILKMDYEKMEEYYKEKPELLN